MDMPLEPLAIGSETSKCAKLAEPWLRVQLEEPGVLLLRRLGPGRAEGSGGPHVRTHWFGRAHLHVERTP